jgi:hypothetical protein
MEDVCIICMLLPLYSQKDPVWLASPIPSKVAFPPTLVPSQHNFATNSIAVTFDLDLDLDLDLDC